MLGKKRLQLDLWQTARHQQPAVIRHDHHLSPAGLEKRPDPADHIANLGLHAARQFPALGVPALVQGAGLGPRRSGRIAHFVRAEALPPTRLQRGREAIMRQKLPRGNQSRRELVARLATLHRVGDR